MLLFAGLGLDSRVPFRLAGLRHYLGGKRAVLHLLLFSLLYQSLSFLLLLKVFFMKDLVALICVISPVGGGNPLRLLVDLWLESAALELDLLLRLLVQRVVFPLLN